MSRLLPRLAAGLAVLAGLAAMPPAAAQVLDVPADVARAEAAFDAARALYDGGLFAPAARALARYRADFPQDPRTPEALFLQASSALASGDDRGAAELFVQFEVDHPTHPLASGARLALGRYYYATGAYDAAETALRAALDRPAPPAQEAEAAYLLGQTALAQSRPEAAADAFDRASRADTPTAPAALYALGTVRVAQSDPARAAEAFEGLAQRYPGTPDDARVGLALAEAYLRLGRREDAVAEIERRQSVLTGDEAARADLLLGETRLILGETEAARRSLSAVPAGSRYARRASLALGRAAYAQDRWAEAVASFGAARAPDAPTDDAVAHEASYYEGLARLRQGDLGEAETRLLETAQRRPDGAYAEAATLEVGLLYYSRRQYAQAAAAFGRLTDATPPGPYAGEAARMLGETYAAQGDPARSRDAFRLAERLGTATADTRAEVAFQDAYALYVGGEYDRATEALLRVAQADRGGQREGEALFWAGESAYQAGRFARAEEILADFVRRFPTHGRADAGRYGLAWTHFARRDYAAAAAGFEAFLSAYQRGPEPVPYYADALLRLADSYTQLRRFDDARQVYALIPDATPTGQGADYALFQTALSYASEGRTAEAAEAYRRLADTYPRSDLLDAALLARGTLLVQSDPEAAVADFERVLRERPSGTFAAAAAVGIGDARYNQDRFDDAEAAYRRALDRYPGSPAVADALAGLDYTLAAVGRSDEFPELVATVEARATDPEARARVRLARARATRSAGDTAGTVALLEELAARPPPPSVEPEALLALADAYTAADRPGDAPAPLRRLLSRYPQSPLAPEAGLQLAESLLAAGDAQAALDAATRFATSYPDDAERVATALRIEARALAALGRTAEADARLQTLLGRFPGSAAARLTARERPDLTPAPVAPTDGND